MTRDPELEKKILLELERQGQIYAVPGSLTIPGHPDGQVYQHTKLLADRGLVVAVPYSSGSGTFYFALSSEGIAFLDALRKDRPVAKLKLATGSATIEVLKLLAAATVGAIVTKLIALIHWP